MPEFADLVARLAERYHFDPEAADARAAKLSLGQRDDFCSCPKEDGMYGENGWHWRVDPAKPERKLADIAVEKCSRYQQAVAQNAADPERALLQQAGVPPAYLDCSLATWEGRLPPEIRPYAAEPSGNLLLLGAPGRGKTHLATAVAREALRADLHVCWRSVPEILGGSRKGDFAWLDKQLQALQYADLAILDDLGGERGTEHDLSAIAEVVHHRDAQRWPTVATTNLTEEKLSERDGRIASRLASGAVVELSGRDRRLRGVA